MVRDGAKDEARQHFKLAIEAGSGSARCHIEYAKLAQSMVMYGEGPISDPKDLGPALQRALDVVNRGEPAVVDVVTQPR